MLAVAILRCAGDDDWRAQTVAAITGSTLPEARRRVRPPPPKLVAASRDGTAVDRMVTALSHEGFAPCSIDADDVRRPERSVRVRAFEVTERGLSGLDGRGQRWSCPFDDVSAIVRGTRSSAPKELTTTDIERQLEAEWKLYGEVVTLPRPQPQQNGFLRVFVRGGRTLVLDQESLSYEGLGTARRESRSLNFTQLLELLRVRAPLAPFDDRLNTPEGQRHVMGDVLDTGRYLEVATTLLGKFLAAQSGPYR